MKEQPKTFRVVKKQGYKKPKWKVKIDKIQDADAVSVKMSTFTSGRPDNGKMVIDFSVQSALNKQLFEWVKIHDQRNVTIEISTENSQVEKWTMVASPVEIGITDLDVMMDSWIISIQLDISNFKID